MEILVYIFVFFFGLTVGSFLNCVIYRLALHQYIGEGLKGRSFCPNCKHQLSWQDLIPLLSFLILKGKCRYCKKPISWQYPLVELATAIVFLSIFQLTIDNQQLAIPSIFNFCYLLIVACFLIVIFVYDLEHYVIPDKIIYPAILVSGIWYLVSGIFFNTYTKYEILNTIYSVFGAAVFFLLIVLVSRGKWMGAGDIKLAFLMGLILGFPKILAALFLAFLVGAIIGVGLILGGKKTLKSEVPFGPFLVTGTFIALFWGENIIKWYLNFFNV